MTITKYLLIGLLLWPVGAQAEEAKHDHVGAIYHAVRLETGVDKDGGVWAADGWIGGDVHKVWLKSEGEVRHGRGKGDLSLSYSRNVATFWDAQIGVRQDIGDSDHTYLSVGVNGLAPYFFETEAHLFVRDDGTVSARLSQSNAWLLTNRLIVEPSVEIEFNGEADPALHLGTGLTHAEAALQLRYEVTRRFAPYVEWSYGRRFGQTADFARAHGEPVEDHRTTLGIRWLF